MISGVTAVGVYAVSQLPSEYDLSEPDSLTLLATEPFGGRVYLLEAAPLDPSTGTVVTKLLPGVEGLSNIDFRTLPADSLPNCFFEGRLINPYNVQYSVFDGGRLATRSIPAFGEVRINNPDGGADQLASYAWAWRTLTIKAGLPTFGYDDFGLIFTGTVESFSWTYSEFVLHLRDRQYLLAKNIQQNLYAGTGALEGGDEIKGKPKPLCYGQAREAEPVPVDTTNLIYQVHDGAVNAIASVKDGGIALTFDSDVADISATAAPVSGHYKTQISGGYLRLGATPERALTCDVQGDKTGGTYVYTAADIIRRILTTRGGLVDADLDLASFSTANTANSTVQGRYIRDDAAEVQEIIDDLAGSVHGFWTYTRQGLFRFVILSSFEDETPTAVLSQDSDVVADALERPTSVPPAKLIRLGYKHFWTTQEGSSLGTSVSAADRAQYAQEYRTVIADNSDIATTYLDAEELDYVSLTDTETDAQAEVTRRMGLYGVAREMLKVPLVVGLYNYNLGDVIELGEDFTRYGLAFWKGRLVGLVEDVGTADTPATIELELWGSMAGSWLTVDGGFWQTVDGGRWLTV